MSPPHEGPAPRSVLGHLHCFFTLSMIPPASPLWGDRAHGCSVL